MIFDSRFSGPQGLTREELRYTTSTFSEVRNAIFANSYYLTWGAPESPPLPVYGVTLGRALRGALPFGRRWGFQQAANRSVDSRADLRLGRDGRGFRRILHPNGVCLTGTWEIDQAAANYTGYFQAGRKALIVGRYSVCCSETRRGRYRSLSLVGKLYPTLNREDSRPMTTANFITQEDLGGSKSHDISEVELRNNPDVTAWRRGRGLPVFLLTAFVLLRADKQPVIRQLYEIAELGKPVDQRTIAPASMRLLAEPPRGMIGGEDLDFRDEVLARIYDKGNQQPQRRLTFHIEVSDDEGRVEGLLSRRRVITGWKRIGRIVFDEAVASYNGDFVVHFHHAAWRNDRNNPLSLARPRRALA